VDVEREVRQLLANRVSGNMVGIWLLVPELVRLGAWDLLRGWSGASGTSDIAPRLALHLVNEAALGTYVRQRTILSQKGFEVANGLPFVPDDKAVHDLLAAHTMRDAQNLQLALGRIRRASGHFRGRVLAVDPHHMTSHTKRQTRRHRHHPGEKAIKTSQTLFLLDTDTEEPVCCSLASPSRPVAQTVPELLRLGASILVPGNSRPLVLADGEHFAKALFDEAPRLGFDLLVPMPRGASYLRTMAAIPSSDFKRRWPGYATARIPFRFRGGDEEYTLMVQREGERPEDYRFDGFLCTSPRDELEALCEQFPKRWRIEEFFNRDQSIGWQRAGTLNLNIRYNHLALTLLAQAAIDQFRNRLPESHRTANAETLARGFFNGIDGDLRVCDDTIIVTYYNAPDDEQWRQHYEQLPARLGAEGIPAAIPWLFGFKLNFRFR